MKATRIAAVQLICRDIAATANFYRSAFGCNIQPAANTSGLGSTRLMLGEQLIELVTTDSPSPTSAPSNSAAFQHFAIVVSNIGAAMQKLSDCRGWTPITRGGPQALPLSSGGVTAFKFRDPEGHPLELLQFPDGAGPLIWRESGPGPFLGIDHSAITVGDTVRSILFYQGLGFSVLGRQLNRGTEQEKLDDVPGAVVEVTGLALPDSATPHLELLCYRTPPTTVADALPSTRLILDAGRSGRTALRFQADLPVTDAEETSVRDPDGHVSIFH